MITKFFVPGDELRRENHHNVKEDVLHFIGVGSGGFPLNPICVDRYSKG